MRSGADRRRGNTLVEFTLIGIPVIFVLISIFEVSRGMWIYHTMAHAMKDGLRYAIVHGNNCNLYPNSCAVTVRMIANRIKESGVGLVPDEVLNVTFESADTTRTVTCAKLSDCLKAGNPGDYYWPVNPPGDEPSVGGLRKSDLEIRAVYPFRSALSMLWPGAGRVSFATVNLPATARERIQY